MFSVRTLFFIAMTVAIIPFAFASKMYGQKDNHRWIMDNKAPLYCSIHQDIPYYGSVRFQREAGGAISFVVTPNSMPNEGTRFLLRSVHPKHKPGLAPNDLGELPVSKDSFSIRLNGSKAFRLLQDLERDMEDGLTPVLYYQDKATSRIVNVTLEPKPLTFQETLHDFVQCSKKLLNYTFDDIDYSEVYFSTNSKYLNNSSRRTLRKVVDYVKADPKIRRISLHGFTDGIGNKKINIYVSRERAKSVAKFLKENGIDPKLIEIFTHGKETLFFSNRSEEGRAKNRKVAIKVERDEV